MGDPCTGFIILDKNWKSIENFRFWAYNEYEYICNALNKDFVTANVKIKYFMAIVQNKIEDYKKMEENNKIHSISFSNLEEEIVIKEQKVTRKKSIFEM